MAVVVEELIVRLSAQMDQYNFALAGAQRDTDARLSAVEARYAKFGNNLNTTVSRAALQVNGALASVGVGLGIGELASYADAWTRVTRSLEGTEKVYGIQVASAKEVAAIATETRSDLEATEKLYVRTAVSVAKLGLDMGVAAETTATFSKSLKLGGASTQEQKAAMEQFSQALQKGKLDGDEFRTIMESAGVVQQALIEKFKVSGSVLIDMAHKGQLTSKDLIAALQQIKPKVDAAFAAAPATLSESFINLKTAITQYIGEANRGEGVTGALASGLNSLAQNMDTTAKAAAVIGAALLVAFAPEIIGSIAAVAAAAASVPILMAAGAAAVYEFGDKIGIAGTRSATLQDVISALGGEVKDGLGTAFAYASEKLQWLADALRSVFSGAGVTQEFTDFLTGIKAVLNTVIGVFAAATLAIGAQITLVLGAIPSAAIEALNAVLAAVQYIARDIGHVLNKLPGVKIDVDTGEITQLPNTFKDSSKAAEAIWSTAFQAIGVDYIGSMAAAGSAVKTQILKDAQEIALGRGFAANTTVKREGAGQKIYPDKPKEDKYTKELEQIKKRTELLVAEAGAVGKSTAEQDRAKATQELLTAAREADLKVTPQLLADIDKLATAYGNASAKLELLRKIQSTQEENEATKREIALTGLYGQELTRARVEAELLAEARKAGVALTDAEQARIKSIASEAASLKQLQETINAVRDTSRDALKGFINDLRAGKTGAEALQGALNKIADKLVDMAVNQLVEAALGPLLKGATGGGGGGGLIGKLFGFADGGVMTPGGPRGLNKFAGGGTSTTAAIFGEAGPEAAVPLPDGRRIPVELRLPNINSAAQQAATAPQQPSASVTVAPVFNLSGSVSAADLANLKSEILSILPDAVQSGVVKAFDRNARFRRSGI